MIIMFFKRLKTVYLGKGSLYKTIFYNFKYLSFRLAIKLPIIVAKGVVIKENGKIKINISDDFTNPSIYFGGKTLNWMPSPSLNHTTIWLNGVMIINSGFYFASGGGIEVDSGAVLSFGENFTSTGNCTIICRNNIEFGNDVLVSWDTLFMDSDQHSIYLQQDNSLFNCDGTISIGDHVWISCRSVILKNSRIASNCIVGAQSVVNNNFLFENAVIAGCPAKVINSSISWGMNRPLKMNESCIKKI